MTTEEKIDQIHQAVTNIQAQMSADKSICAAKHEALDDRLHGLHRVIKGNGQPGIEGKQEILARRFDRLEAKVLAWVGVGTAAGSILGPVVMEWVKR